MCTVVECLIWSLEIIVVREGGEPARSTGSGAHPRLMEAIDPHRKRLEPFFDQILLDLVEVTAQIAPRERGQIAYPVDEKCRVREVVFLDQPAEKLGGGIGATPF